MSVYYDVLLEVWGDVSRLEARLEALSEWDRLLRRRRPDETDEERRQREERRDWKARDQ